MARRAPPCPSPSPDPRIREGSGGSVCRRTGRAGGQKDPKGGDTGPSPGTHVPGLASVPRSQPALKCARSPTQSPFMVRRSHAHRLWIFTPLPSRVPTPPAWGSVTPGPLTRPTSWKGGRSARDRQGQLVSGEEGSCVPGPSHSPPRLLLSPGPPARARSAMEFPQRCPPPTWRGRGCSEADGAARVWFI